MHLIPWSRFDNPSRTKCMQYAMNKADRETRSKALRLVYICQQRDAMLNLCPQVSTSTLLSIYVMLYSSGSAILFYKLDCKLCHCLLQGFIAMILHNMFDTDIDQLPGWQTVDLEHCFINILTNWQQHMVCNSNYVL